LRISFVVLVTSESETKVANDDNEKKVGIFNGFCAAKGAYPYAVNSNCFDYF
jgi:hypothetical protein